MANASPFHAGEQQVQERLGVREIDDWARKVVRSYLPEQHRDFYSGLPFLVAAARDLEGRPWVTLLSGEAGFATSPNPNTLAIEAQPAPGDALEGALVPGSDLGLLGIELAERRRNRVNGRIRASNTKGVIVEVDQSFGNCPQYIREREWTWNGVEDAKPAEQGDALSESQRAWIAGADTFFIASGHRAEGEDEAFGMDASHRGGEPGFVRVQGTRRIVFPDYAGNNHFNTIGNLVVDPRVGVVFVDFEKGSLLQITGRAEIDWDSPAVTEVPGARRLVSIEIEAVVELQNALPLRWVADASSVRSLRVVEKIRESEEITSFVFTARDGGPLPDFEPGQHIPIELEVPGQGEPVRRTYSLSGPRGAEFYRISVKRESLGVASRHLHDHIEPGTILSARSPAGDFVLPQDGRPVVLVSAGVGVTPMMSMLYTLAEEGDDRPVLFLHGARDGAHHALRREVDELAARRPGIRTHIAYSKPRPEDELGRDYDSEGRIDAAMIASLVDVPDAHYMLCGPTAFMADVQEALEGQGVAAGRIHWEAFSA